MYIYMYVLYIIYADYVVFFVIQHHHYVHDHINFVANAYMFVANEEYYMQ